MTIYLNQISDKLQIHVTNYTYKLQLQILRVHVAKNLVR